MLSDQAPATRILDRTSEGHEYLGRCRKFQHFMGALNTKNYLYVRGALYLCSVNFTVFYHGCPLSEILAMLALVTN